MAALDRYLFLVGISSLHYEEWFLISPPEDTTGAVLQKANWLNQEWAIFPLKDLWKIDGRVVNRMEKYIRQVQKKRGEITNITIHNIKWATAAACGMRINNIQNTQSSINIAQ